MALRSLVIALLGALLGAVTNASAWNIPTHMITGAMAHRLLQSQNPQAAASVQALLEKHPWYADRWRDEIARLPEAQRSEALFMWAARWADDIRTQFRWHYINWPFKPGEPETVQARTPKRSWKRFATLLSSTVAPIRSNDKAISTKFPSFLTDQSGSVLSCSRGPSLGS